MKLRNIILSLVIILLFISSLVIFFVYPRMNNTNNLNTSDVNTEKVIDKENSLEKEIQINKDVEVEPVVDNLIVPWELVFLPNGNMLITERIGNLVRISENERKSIKVEGVNPTSEGGLLGLALHPKFSENNKIFVYITYRKGLNLFNKVVRYDFKDDTLSNEFVVIDNIPGSSNHDGGRIKFGPDGKLYITTGDAGNEKSSQDINSLAGKILRINEDGTFSENIAPNSPVYSLGHRNSQGIAWDSLGNLWSTEHGRSGIASGLDELNSIEKGGNYGWPEIEGDKTKEGMKTPVIHSGSDTTWAPSNLVIYQNYAIFTGLRGQSLYIYNIETKELTSLFKNEYGRLRALTIGIDGFLYFGSSNTDGRGNPGKEDDRIYRLQLSKLFK